MFIQFTFVIPLDIPKQDSVENITPIKKYNRIVYEKDYKVMF